MSKGNNKSTKNNSGNSGQNSARRSVRNRSEKKGKGRNNQPRAIVRSPVPVSTGMVVRQQNYKHKSSYIVPHTEYIGDIAANTELFHLDKSFILNPGDPDTFPWCSQFGNLYESYIFRKLKFRYEPSCSTSTQGYVAFVPDFNPLEAAPANKQQAFQNEKTVRGSPFKNFSVSFTHEQLNKRKTYFARSNSEVVADANKEVYDTGNLRVYVGGCTDNSTSLGEVWVDYEVEFFTPEAPTQALSTIVINSPVSGVNTTNLNPLRADIGTTVLSSNITDMLDFVTSGGNESMIIFKKPFQGQVTAKSIGTALNTLVGAITTGATSDLKFPLSPVSTTNPAQTSSIWSQFVSSPPGGKIGFSMSGSGSPTITSSVISLLSANNPGILMNGF